MQRSLVKISLPKLPAFYFVAEVLKRTGWWHPGMPRCAGWEQLRVTPWAAEKGALFCVSVQGFRNLGEN